MLSEHLVLPHANKAHGATSQPLLEAARLEEIQEDIVWLRAQGETPEAIDDFIFATADRVSQMVHSSLWFRYNKKNPPPVNEDYISKTKETSCFGYAIALSECLEEAKIDHWVAFTNNHGYAVVPNASRTRAWLINPSQPKLNGELSLHHISRTLEGIEEQIACDGKSTAYLNTDEYVKSHFKNRFCDVVSMEASVWMTLESDEAITRQRDDARGYVYQKHENMLRKRLLPTAFYAPGVGRMVLTEYSAFQYYVAHNDFEAAQQCLIKLGDKYPEIDARNRQEHLRKTLAGLITAGAFGASAKIIELFTKSMSQTYDPRTNTWRADLYRKLGAECRQIEILRTSRDIYEAARTEANASIIDSKVKKTEVLIQRISTEKLDYS